jgi:hypothetical protein
MYSIQIARQIMPALDKIKKNTVCAVKHERSNTNTVRAKISAMCIPMEKSSNVLFTARSGFLEGAT